VGEELSVRENQFQPTAKEKSTSGANAEPKRKRMM
jgi:hypothetical protein